MKANWKAIGLVAVSAALLYYPAKKLYEYLAANKSDEDSSEGEAHVMKAFVPAYRGKHKPHHRHANGAGNHDGANAG